MNLIRIMPAEGCEMPAQPSLRDASVRGAEPVDIWPGLPARAAAILGAIRARTPRVHCITNNVAQAFTANMLLAAGASPSMSHAPDEVADFVARADSVLVNIGTLDAERRVAARLAAEVAALQGKPWALDPVFVQASTARLRLATELVARRPAVVRANAEELAALEDATVDDHDAAALRFAAACGTVICRTGPVDLVTDGARMLRIANGHPLMGRVTAVGCAGTALMCAALAVEEDPLIAAGAMFLVLGVCGEIAAERAQGPGAFAVELIDAVYRCDERALSERVRRQA